MPLQTELDAMYPAGIKILLPDLNVPVILSAVQLWD